MITLTAQLLMCGVLSIHLHDRHPVSGPCPQFNEDAGSETGGAADCVFCVMQGQWTGEPIRSLPASLHPYLHPVGDRTSPSLAQNADTDFPSRGPPSASAF